MERYLWDIGEDKQELLYSAEFASPSHFEVKDSRENIRDSIPFGKSALQNLKEEASSTGFSYYAVKLEQDENETTENPVVEEFEVEKFNQTANITIQVRNPSNSTLKDNLTIKENGRKITEQISLRPLQEKNISLTRELDSGNYTYTKGGLTEKLAIKEEKDVTEEKNEKKERPIPVLLLALAGTIITIFFFMKDGLEEKIREFRFDSKQTSEKEG